MINNKIPEKLIRMITLTKNNYLFHQSATPNKQTGSDMNTYLLGPKTLAPSVFEFI